MFRTTFGFIYTFMTLAANAQNTSPLWEMKYRSSPLQYSIYGGELSEAISANQQDRKISLHISGVGAKDIFNAIGPDKKDACGAGSDLRIREKDDGKISCSLYKKDYSCYVGFDLNTGKSIGGAIC